MSDSEQLKVRRLGWAGLEVELDGHVLVIDLLEDNSPLAPFVGEPHTDLPPPSAAGSAAAALVTHLHSDHADPAAIANALRDSGPVLRPDRSDGEGLEVISTTFAENGFEDLGLEAVSLNVWDQHLVGPFTITAVPAVDGLGDPQVSWVIEGGGRRILHAGDTIFHGSWWTIAVRCGPIDVAFLPVNGAVVDLPHRQPRHALACSMDPVQAASAAAILQARLAVPIHYDTIHSPPTYAQVGSPAASFQAAAGELGVAARTVAIGETVELPASLPAEVAQGSEAGR